MARVFLTGATGFVGAHVLDVLLAEGHHVHALVRRPEAEPALRARGVVPVPGDLASVGDIVLPDVDAVVHLAALVDPALQDDARRVDALVRGATLSLAERARTAGVQRFVFTSSIAAVGFHDGLVTADSPCHPSTGYGIAKRACERALLAEASARFSPVILRPPTIHGPGERYNFLALVRAIDRGLFRTIGGGRNVFPLVSVANVARAVVAAAEGRIGAGIHPLADAERYPMQRVHRAIASALGRDPPRFPNLPMPIASVAARVNEALARVGAPLLLSRARVRTLSVDQPFDVASLLACGVDLRADLEREVALTVADQRRRGLLARAQ